MAKTLLIKTLAQAVQADFSRIQFTPDLLPANLILADEINRAPAAGI